MQTKRNSTNKYAALQVFYDAFEIANIICSETFDKDGNIIKVPESKWPARLTKDMEQTRTAPLPDNYSNYLKDRFNHLRRIEFDETKINFGYYESQWIPLVQYSNGFSQNPKPLNFNIFYSKRKIGALHFWSTPDYGKLYLIGKTVLFESSKTRIAFKNIQHTEIITMPRKPWQWIKISYRVNGQLSLGYISISDNKVGTLPAKPLQKIFDSLLQS